MTLSIKGIFKTVAQYCSGYTADAALVKKYTGMVLSEEAFEVYKKTGFTLRKSFGSDRDIYGRYYGLGTPMEISGADILGDVLQALAQNKVVFDISKEGCNDVLFDKLVNAANRYLVKGLWPCIPAPYKDEPRLIEQVKNIRAARKMNPLEQVM